VNNTCIYLSCLVGSSVATNSDRITSTAQYLNSVPFNTLQVPNNNNVAQNNSNQGSASSILMPLPQLQTQFSNSSSTQLTPRTTVISLSPTTSLLGAMDKKFNNNFDETNNKHKLDNNNDNNNSISYAPLFKKKREWIKDLSNNNNNNTIINSNGNDGQSSGEKETIHRPSILARKGVHSGSNSSNSSKTNSPELAINDNSIPLLLSLSSGNSNVESNSNCNVSTPYTKKKSPTNNKYINSNNVTFKALSTTTVTNNNNNTLSGNNIRFASPNTFNCATALSLLSGVISPIDWSKYTYALNNNTSSNSNIDVSINQHTMNINTTSQEIRQHSLSLDTTTSEDDNLSQTDYPHNLTSNNNNTMILFNYDNNSNMIHEDTVENEWTKSVVNVKDISRHVPMNCTSNQNMVA
jgi:hypothetical protein